MYPRLCIHSCVCHLFSHLRFYNKWVTWGTRVDPRRYCSNWYPHERSIYIEVCNWCAPQAMGKAMNTTLLTSHPTRHMDHVDNAHQNNSIDADNNDKNDDVGMPMYSTPRKTHDHDHHPAHAHHRLIKKTSKRLVVRRYKFVSEV